MVQRANVPIRRLEPERRPITSAGEIPLRQVSWPPPVCVTPGWAS